MNTIPGLSNETLDIFEPALFNSYELDFIARHLCEPPAAVFTGSLPRHVNRQQVQPFLQRCYDLDQIETYKEIPWAGKDLVLKAIETYRLWQDECAEIARRGGPKHPSNYAWDGDGSGIKYGPGSDSGLVRTRIDEDGNRQRLAIVLTRPSGQADLSDAYYRPNFGQHKTAPKALIEDADKTRIECPVCGFTTSWKKGNTRTYSMARMNMGKHLLQADTEVGLHRALHTSVFRTKDAHRLRDA